MYLIKEINDGYFCVDGMIQGYHIYQDSWVTEHVDRLVCSTVARNIHNPLAATMPFSLAYLQAMAFSFTKYLLKDPLFF